MAEASAETAPELAPLLVFIHIPKTAGTTLKSILRANEPGNRTRQGGNVFKGSGGVKEGVQFENLLNNDAGGLDEARVLMGHFPLGIRESLPADRERAFMTMLRAPADRTLSHYFSIRERRAGGDGSGKLGLPPLPPDPTLEDLLERGYIHDNLQTRMLSGLAEPFAAVTGEMLEEAKRNLREEFIFVGITERFDESLVLAKQRLGFRTILYRPQTAHAGGGRVNANRPRGGEIPKALAEAAESCNRYDIELYRYAEELFEEAIGTGAVEFEVELEALRVARGSGDPGAPPAGFGGDEQTWRALIDAKAGLLEREKELADLSVEFEEHKEREAEALADLERIHARGKAVAGRDAETAMRMIEIVAPARARKLAAAADSPETDG